MALIRALTPEAEAKLQELEETARELAEVEARAQELRALRNRRIFETVKAGTTERKAATAADVDPAYAHRCVVAKGKPTSGHGRRGAE